MKKAWILLIILPAVVVTLAQEKPSPIMVKEATTTTGVVIVTADMAGKSVQLQCTASMPDCAALKNGKYVIVLLPKNHGMYDCQNVDVYAPDANPATDQRIGEYCLTQK
jgi:hypothetical protein